MKNASTVLVIAILIALTGCATTKLDSQATTETNSREATDDIKKVTGRNDWSGYIKGQPDPKSKFNKLEIGMGSNEVMDLVGLPTDQSSHGTGKFYIPFYHGSGKMEAWHYYKGEGRLLFASDADMINMFLIGIEYDENESGYQ